MRRPKAKVKTTKRPRLERKTMKRRRSQRVSSTTPSKIVLHLRTVRKLDHELHADGGFADSAPKKRKAAPEAVEPATKKTKTDDVVDEEDEDDAPEVEEDDEDEEDEAEGEEDEPAVKTKVISGSEPKAGAAEAAHEQFDDENEEE